MSQGYNPNRDKDGKFGSGGGSSGGSGGASGSSIGPIGPKVESLPHKGPIGPIKGPISSKVPLATRTKDRFKSGTGFPRREMPLISKPYGPIGPAVEQGTKTSVAKLHSARKAKN